MKSALLGRLGSLARRRPGWMILGILLLTALLLVPLLTMAPSEQASDQPAGEVFDLFDRVTEKFPPSVHPISFIVEARDGDLLTQRELWELYRNEQRLRNSEIGKEFLYTRYDEASGRSIQGLYTIADAVEEALRASSTLTLEQASDEQVKEAIYFLLANPKTSGLSDWFSVKATKERRTLRGQEMDYWRSPALAFMVLADNEKLGGGAQRIGLGGDESVRRKEALNREVQEILRGDEGSYRLWGIAIDLNLESQEEGKTSVPLIIAAVIVILVIVALYFRSLLINLLTLLGIVMLIVWLKGISNLIGLRSSLILDIIVPVAILILGVDYAIHSLHRYREEGEKGASPGMALEKSIVGVGGALILAMLTTAVAFLSNATSGIETVIGFGVAAAIAIFSALIIMGFFVPTLKMKLDAWRLRKALPGEDPEPRISPQGETRQRGKFLAKTLCSLAQRWPLVLPLVFLLTGVAFFYATKLEAKLDAKEYFDPDSDFVVSLDKVDEHVARKAGEPAIIYVAGDLSQPQSLAAIRALISNMEDDETVARRMDDGRADAWAGLFDFIAAVMESEVAQKRVEAASPGVLLTDDNRDGLPDTPEQLRALYDYMVREGIPLEEKTLRYEPSLIGESFFHDPSGAEKDATLVYIGIPGTREQAVVTESREELLEDMKALIGVDSISHAGLTGTAYTREASLNATTRALTTSILVAVSLCFLILLVAFRSLRYSIVTLLPILLVATWLYAFMYLGGYHLNAITATIAAISIGVGIDYSIYVAVRFLQERTRIKDKREALEQAIRQSGSALFGSASSTFLGFVVIAFAPMPMFSSFGLLTAAMIFLALAAALLVLPSMLLAVTRES